MTRHPVPMRLLARLLAPAAFAASAQAVSLSAEGDAAAQAPLGNDGRLAAGFNSSARPGIDRNCLQSTGSRIVPHTTRGGAATNGDSKQRRQCVAANGRVYSREDIERTGEVDIYDALRKLDPAIY